MLNPAQFAATMLADDDESFAYAYADTAALLHRLTAPARPKLAPQSAPGKPIQLFDDLIAGRISEMAFHLGMQSC